MAKQRSTLLDRLITSLKNQPVVARVTLIGIAVVAFAQFTGALNSVVNFTRSFGASDRASAQAEYCQLLRPLLAEFDRSKDAFDRWNDRNLPLEQGTIRDANLTARDLLRRKAHLIPPYLAEDARLLIQHYDRWLEEYQKIRGGPRPDTTTAFVFVGPEGFPFPRESERRFRDRAAAIQTKYGTALCV
jgi:hypothetical protein